MLWPFIAGNITRISPKNKSIHLSPQNVMSFGGATATFSSWSHLHYVHNRKNDKLPKARYTPIPLSALMTSSLKNSAKLKQR
ncbi:hypothetical protein T02_15738 [Trichinella nativa]|uniref:Uncharacterized protein n=1 Tax=Trichinella nativa TaxID=6335 RepID=A0A0V1L2U4_9BILA|nr:hypothetical protein T02_15738 [Trichinella nativa]